MHLLQICVIAAYDASYASYYAYNAYNTYIMHFYIHHAYFCRCSASLLHLCVHLVAVLICVLQEALAVNWRISAEIFAYRVFATAVLWGQPPNLSCSGAKKSCVGSRRPGCLRAVKAGTLLVAGATKGSWTARLLWGLLQYPLVLVLYQGGSLRL